MVLLPLHGARDERCKGGFRNEVLLMTNAVEKAAPLPKGDGAVVNTAIIIGAFLLACLVADLLANRGNGVLSLVEFVRALTR